MVKQTDEGVAATEQPQARAAVVLAGLAGVVALVLATSAVSDWLVR